MAKKILILGVGGFIGSSLASAILQRTDWEICGMDLSGEKLNAALKEHPRFQFQIGDITACHAWLEERVQWADVVVPLVAVATPSTYVTNPLRVFELDFEANLPIVRWCAKYGKHLVFPSTSEVYGCSQEPEFSELTSHLVTGPIHEERWIYSTCKQLMDRVIYAYGRHHGLNFTLFRPFNWFGPNLDFVEAMGTVDNGTANQSPENNKQLAGTSRVASQFISAAQKGGELKLVNGGKQRRCFTYIDDGIAALLKIIENRNNCASGQIFNLGNPANECSIEQLAQQILALAQEYPKVAKQAAHAKIVAVEAQDFYAKGYADVQRRVPSIQEAQTKLGWTPQVDLVDGLRRTLDNYWR